MELSTASLAGKDFTLRMENAQAAARVDTSLTPTPIYVSNALPPVLAVSAYILPTVSPAATLLLPSAVATAWKIAKVATSHTTITVWRIRNVVVFQDAGCVPILDFVTNVCLITLELLPANTLI